MVLVPLQIFMLPPMYPAPARPVNSFAGNQRFAFQSCWADANPPAICLLCHGAYGPTKRPRAQVKLTVLMWSNVISFHSLSGSSQGLLTVDLDYIVGFLVYSLSDSGKATKNSHSPWVPCSSQRREKSLWVGCFPDMWGYKRELPAPFLKWLVVSDTWIWMMMIHGRFWLGFGKKKEKGKKSLKSLVVLTLAPACWKQGHFLSDCHSWFTA